MPQDDTWWKADPVASPVGGGAVLPSPPKEAKAPDAPSGYRFKSGGSALEPIPGGPAEVQDAPIDAATTKFYAQQILAGGTMPALGMGKQATAAREAIMNEVARQAGASGMGGDGLARQIAHYKAGTAQISNLEKMVGTIGVNEQTALANGQQAMDRYSELPGQTEFPLVNSVVQSAQRWLPVPGHQTIAAADNALQTFQNEYAKVVSGSPSGAGTLSDSARHEAMNTLQGNYSPTQKAAAFAQLKADMSNRMEAMHRGINDAYANLTKQPGYIVPDVTASLNVAPNGQSQGDNKNAAAVGIGMGSGDGVDGPPQGEVLIGHYKNEDGSLAPIYGKVGTAPPPGAVPLTADEQKQSQIDAQANEIQGRPGLGDIAKNGLTLGLGDEAAGVGGAIGAAVTGRNPIEAYQHERDLARLRLQQARENEGALGTATDLVAGGASLGVGGLMGPAAPRTIASLAKEGAGIGAAAGFGNGEGAQGSLMGAATGATIGGVMGAGAGKLSDTLSARAANPAPASDAAQSLKAGENYGLNLSLGDVGGRGAKMVERTLDAQPAAADIMNAPRKALAGDLQTAVSGMADKFGSPASYRGMGEVAQSGANRWIDKFTDTTSKLYDRIPVKNVADATIDATRSALSNLSNKIGSNPELSDLLASPKFARYLDALTPRKVEAVNTAGVPHKQLTEVGGKLSWQDLKAFRSDIGEQLGEALFTDGTRKGELRTLYSALSSDMEATARSQGPAALRAFQRANDTFKAGQDRIEGAITRLLGNDKGATPEAAAGLIQRIAKEGKGSADLSLLSDIRKTLRPDEWGQLSNGLVRLLGQPANSDGRAFAAQTFIRNFDDMAPEAKSMLFGAPGNPLRASLDDFSGVLRKLAENDSTRNTSGTSFGLGSLMTNSTGATVGASVGGPLGALLGMAAGHGAMAGAAKLWTNPLFVRWATGYAKLAQQPGNTAALTQQIAKLGRIAETQSAIAMDARGVQEYLSKAIGQSPTRAAASDDKSNAGGVPPQQRGQ